MQENVSVIKYKHNKNTLNLSLEMLLHERELQRRHITYHQCTLLRRIRYFHGSVCNILYTCSYPIFSRYWKLSLSFKFPAFSPEVAALHQGCCLQKNLTCSLTTGVWTCCIQNVNGREQVKNNKQFQYLLTLSSIIKFIHSACNEVKRWQQSISCCSDCIKSLFC
jgi:hypothetical protein